MNTSQSKPIDFEYFRLFMYAWNKVHSYYKISSDFNDHLLMEMYEDISSKVDPSKGTPSTYIFKGVSMKLRARLKSINANTLRKYAYDYECGSSHTESAEKSHLRKEFVEKLVARTNLTKGERDLLEEMFFRNMSGAQEARRNLGNPYSRARVDQIYHNMIKKLRKTYEELEGV